MAPNGAGTGPTDPKIPVRLSKAQIARIWPGLSCIVRAYTARSSGLDITTSYPFRMYPLPRGFDSGSFSQQLMDRILAFRAELQRKSKTGGRFRLDSFDLRAAAFSARITGKLGRMRVLKPRKKGAGTLPPSAHERQILAKQFKATQTIVRELERFTKRANRRFIKTASQNEFKALSREWQSHLRWMRFRLVYFKPIRKFLKSLRPRYQDQIDRLVWMAERAIKDRKFQPPSAKSLRHEIRLFVNYCRRGRIPRYHHRYMLENSESPGARARLFEFLEPRLYLRKASAMTKKSGGPRQTHHRVAATNPEVKELIKKLRRMWRRRNTSAEQIQGALKELVVEEGCSTRGLAKNLRVRESALRYYMNLEPDLKVENRAPKVEPAPVKPAPARPAPVGTSPVKPAPIKAAPASLPEVNTDIRKKIEELRASIERRRSGLPNSDAGTSETRATSIAQQAPKEPVQEPEETIKSLQNRLEEVLLDFLEAKSEGAGVKLDPDSFREVFGAVRNYTMISRTGAICMSLPPQISVPSLFEKIKPANHPPGETPTWYLGRWAAGILNSICPGDPDSRELAIKQAKEQALSGKRPRLRAPRQFAGEHEEPRIPQRTPLPPPNPNRRPTKAELLKKLEDCPRRLD